MHGIFQHIATFCTAYMNGSPPAVQGDDQRSKTGHSSCPNFSDLGICVITLDIKLRVTLFLSAPAFPREVRDSGKFLSTTRQGISLLPYTTFYCVDNILAMSSLHVAVQMGPYHDPVSRTSGVWPLRILIKDFLGFWRFMV